MKSKKPVPTQTKPINSIMSIKSNEDLRNYLEERPELNLALMKEKNESTLIHFSAFKNELPKMKIYILHFEAFSKENHRRNKNQPSFQSQLKAWINSQNSDGLTALHFATLHGNTQMIQFLQRYGANMQVQSNDKQNILFMCAQNNHLKTAIYLLEHREGKIKFNVNQGNHLGDTVLHKVAKHGFNNFAAYLLARDDVDIDMRNNQGWTPLMYAVSGGHKQIVKRMLMKGVNRHLVNQQQQRAIDLARSLDKPDMVRILNDEFTNWQRIKIICNIKLIYGVQKPTLAYAITFLILFHIVLIPTHILAEVDLISQDKYYIFYIVVGFYYLLTLIMYCLLTKKHPSKSAKNLLEVQLPICAECRSSIKPIQFHCFSCRKCISRYDHHCPWINNCVSSYNIGKFTCFLLLLIIGCIEVMFLSISFHFNTLDIIKPNRFISIPVEDRNKYSITNMVVSSFLAAVLCLLMFSLLGDQIKNLVSNSTSYERAKNIRRNKQSTLLHSVDGDEGINPESKGSSSVLEDEEEESGGQCCAMLSEKYNQD